MTERMPTRRGVIVRWSIRLVAAAAWGLAGAAAVVASRREVRRSPLSWAARRVARRGAP